MLSGAADEAPILEFRSDSLSFERLFVYSGNWSGKNPDFDIVELSLSYFNCFNWPLPKSRIGILTFLALHFCS